MTIDEIVTLIQAVSDHGLTSFVYEEGNQKLILEKKKKKNVAQTPVAPVVISQPAAPVMSPVAMAVPAETGLVGFAGAGHPGIAETEAEDKAAAANEEHLDIGSDKVVTSPLVGTFYRAPSPEADPFVQVGDTVRKGQVLGIIEAMKLMNEIESEYDGVVEAILVENENVVEYGQPLFRIR
jgi:acetyl-CoA carboxylase, biotin carboxyl carrier protein